MIIGTVPTDEVTTNTQASSAPGVEIVNCPVTTQPPQPAATQPPQPAECNTLVELACPNENPDQYLSTSWFLSAEDRIFHLYHIDHHGIMKYHYNLPGSNVRHYANDTDFVVIVYSETCNYTASYRCRRSAILGHRGEVYNFHVRNCTIQKEADLRPRAITIALGNASPQLTPAAVILGTL